MDIKYLSIYGLSFRKSHGKIFHFEFPLFKMANKLSLGISWQSKMVRTFT